MPTKKTRRALLSVSDKAGLIPFAKSLKKAGFELVSTGGTLKALQKAKVKAIAIDEVTGFPEMLDGRVKTLHPKIHGGLLYKRTNASHKAQAKKHEIEAIDMVVVNLYPFENVANKKVKLAEAQELIDIGGPSMLRSAAKNFDAVTVICDVADYGQVAEELKKKGNTSKELRLKLATKVFSRTAAYDAMIAKKLLEYGKQEKETAMFPEKLALNFKKTEDLRYGENPHQAAAVYVSDLAKNGHAWKQLHGKQLSFNNLVDMGGALDIVSEFPGTAACVVKHTNPCGVATHEVLALALDQAIDGDPISAFGGIIGLNRVCDVDTAKLALERLGFFEIIAAPAYDAAALRVLKTRKNLRILEVPDLDRVCPFEIKMIRSGALVQQRDLPIAARMKELKKKIRFVTKKKLPKNKIDDLIFAFQCAKLVKSNAIVLTQGTKAVGVGAGQMSRVDSTKIACDKAGDQCRGSFLGSDAFFPMADAVEIAAAHGIEAIIQPGGSIRDQDIIDACNANGIAMAVVGERHFRH